MPVFSSCQWLSRSKPQSFLTEGIFGEVMSHSKLLSTQLWAVFRPLRGRLRAGHCFGSGEWLSADLLQSPGLCAAFSPLSDIWNLWLAISLFIVPSILLLSKIFPPIFYLCQLWVSLIVGWKYRQLRYSLLVRCEHSYMTWLCVSLWETVCFLALLRNVYMLELCKKITIVSCFSVWI